MFNSDLNRSLVQARHTPYAVLDLHFSLEEPDVLAVATSIGLVCFFKVDVDSLDVQPLKEVCSIGIAGQSILVLSLAWCPAPQQAGLLAASLSNGTITVFRSRNSRRQELPRLAKCHTLEVWTVAWSPVDFGEHELLFSGGDDSAINAHELNSQSQDFPVDQSQKQRDHKTHGAGVTAILPLATVDSKEQIVVTGSYDESVRVLAIPPSASRNRWQCLAEKHLHGGVWRLKLMKSSSLGACSVFIVLASCMHAGARVLTIRRLESTEWAITVSAKFEEHQSMNYAGDARFESDKGRTQKFTVVSTSFYDKKMCVWKYENARRVVEDQETSDQLTGQG